MDRTKTLDTPVRNADDEYRSDVVGNVAFGHFVHDLYSSFLSPFLPLLIAKFSLSMTLAGILSMVFRLTSVLNPILGILADRFDLKLWFALTPFATATAMCLLGNAPDFAVLCLLVLAAGASASLMHVIGPVLAAKYSGTRTGRAMSIWMAAGELARTVAPPAAVALVAALGFDNLYPAAVFGAAASVFLWIKLRALPAAEIPGERISLFRIPARMRALMVVLSGILAARAMVSLVMMRYLPTYLVDTGKTLWTAGLGLALLELCGVVGAFCAGYLSDRFGRRQVLGASMLGAPIFMLALVQTDGPMLIPVLILLGFFSMASMPVTLAVVQDSVPPEQRGTANGLFMGMSALLGASILCLTGILVDIVGFKIGFSLCAVLGLAGVPLVAKLPDETVPVS